MRVVGRKVLCEGCREEGVCVRVVGGRCCVRVVGRKVLCEGCIVHCALFSAKTDDSLFFFFFFFFFLQPESCRTAYWNQCRHQV